MRRTHVKIDHVALIATGAVVVGWFVMATLVVNFGLWQEGIRFYDLLAVIHDPAGRISGIDRSHSLATLGFGLVCAAAVVAPLAPMFYRRRTAWLAYLIPFILMTVTCAVLYAKTSSGPIATESGSPATSAYWARIAQSAVARATDIAATRISIGAGAYVAMLASLWLALRGVSRFRAVGDGEFERGSEGLPERRQRNTGARQIEP